MSTKFTLDSFREAAEAQFGSTVIDFGAGEVELVNVLRLPKTKREAIQASFTSISEASDADREAIMADIIRHAATNEANADALLELIGDDLALLMEVVTTYAKGTQVGEASPSQG